MRDPAACGAQSVVEKASIDEVYMDVTALVDDELRSRESSRAPCEVHPPCLCHAALTMGPAHSGTADTLHDLWTDYIT